METPNAEFTAMSAIWNSMIKGNGNNFCVTRKAVATAEGGTVNMATMRRRPDFDGIDVSEPPADRGPSPLLVSARRAAAMCDKSLRTWRTWDAAGWIPRPVRIGRSTLWRANELREWVLQGCPRRAEWEARS